LTCSSFFPCPLTPPLEGCGTLSDIRLLDDEDFSALGFSGRQASDLLAALDASEAELAAPERRASLASLLQARLADEQVRQVAEAGAHRRSLTALAKALGYALRMPMLRAVATTPGGADDKRPPLPPPPGGRQSAEEGALPPLSSPPPHAALFASSRTTVESMLSDLQTLLDTPDRISCFPAVGSGGEKEEGGYEAIAEKILDAVKAKMSSSSSSGTLLGKVVAAVEQAQVSHSHETCATQSSLESDRGLLKSTSSRTSGDWKKLHSACRWGRIAELTDLLAVTSIEATDDKNGNKPIHIASQNGHLDIVKLLITKGCNVNAQNLGGQAPLHMAMEYDFFHVVTCLEKSGADPDLKNEAGIAAKNGIDGGKVRACVQIQCGETESDFLEGLATLLNDEVSRGRADKAELVQVRMKMKKDNPGWTAAVDEKFKELLAMV